MENVKKSRQIALGLIEETKDVYSSVDTPRNISKDIDIAVPSTSKAKRPTEIVKYGKITFNTTAILHHYPQMSNKETSIKVATKKSDLNLPEPKVDNNNKLAKKLDSKKDNCNNNENTKANLTTDNAIEVLNQPVKFTEEKLV